MIKVALCDDDLSTLNEVSALIEQYRTERNQEIEYTTFHSSLELLAEFEKGASPDILFLDVIMPGEDGISVAKEIRQYNDIIKIIFLTSSSEFAVESYTVGAYFYQVKPICMEDFFRLMDSVISEFEEIRQRSLILHSKSGITRISLTKLEYCEVIGRTLFFHLENGNIAENNGSMDELCSKLTNYDNFIRPHRSFLVNMEYIQSISYKAITMSDHAKIPIPHGKCSEIKNKYLEYAFSSKQVFIS